MSAEGDHDVPRVLKSRSSPQPQPAEPKITRRLKKPAVVQIAVGKPPYSAVEASRIAFGLSIVVSGYVMETSKEVWCKRCYDEVSQRDNGYAKELAGAGWAVSLYDDGEAVVCRRCGDSFQGSPDRWYRPWKI
jgi:hypothetical protein